MVPSGAEMIVRGKIDDENQYFSKIPAVKVEATSNSVLTQQGILVAKALVNPSHGTVPLRLLNLSSEPQCLYQRAMAATAKLVE